MKIGNLCLYENKGIGNKLRNFFTKYLGVIDLHTHYRIKPLLKYFNKEKNKLPSGGILEIGCGCGNNLIDLHQIIGDKLEMYGYDIDKNAIDMGLRIIKENNMKNIHLFNKDVTKYSFDKQKNYNYILFIDILEHIKEDYKFIDSISHYFTDNTKICISIPMKNYKYVVGEKAHKGVGHVRDGYNETEILNLFSKYGYKKESIEYSTGFFGKIGLKLFAKYNFGNKYINYIKRILILVLFKHIDFVNNEKISTSMFITLKK